MTTMEDKKAEVNMNSFKDALRHIKYITKHRIIIHSGNLYAMKTSSGNEKRKHGIVLKATATECVNQAAPKASPCEASFDDL